MLKSANNRVGSPWRTLLHTLLQVGWSSGRDRKQEQCHHHHQRHHHHIHSSCGDGAYSQSLCWYVACRRCVRAQSNCFTHAKQWAC